MHKEYKAHPWHGVSLGNKVPEVVRTFIEIVPTDTVKYEIDKKTGFLMIDRPQKYSNVIPALYGFLPKTISGPRVAELSNECLDRDDIVGDNDPVDICVLTEKAISHGDIIVHARPIGGFRLIDNGQADDKLIAVLDNDAIYSAYKDITDIPLPVIERLRHYFTTYKDIPGQTERKCVLTDIYNRDVAYDVIRRSILDYNEKFSLSSLDD
ncbi:inorganic pyrophosphatase [Dysgonomonas sp. OttesenSCG-928-M03]|nr:inorganic pyrophosphatase [Dysgonomonas sp. OttesenSCG-928-M03]